MLCASILLSALAANDWTLPPPFQRPSARRLVGGSSVDCRFNDSMIEQFDVAAELEAATQHCENPACKSALSQSMARNYEEAWGRPFNGTIADFALDCWCEGNIGVMSHGAIVIDTFQEMHATCADDQCKKVKAHTLERHMHYICTAGESYGGKCPQPGREATMATLVTECSCDYHALGWPFPWSVLDSKIEDEALGRMCGLPSCDQFLARLNEIWPDDANPGIRKCGVNSPWEVVGQAVAGLIVLIGLLASAQICRKAHREAELRAAAVGLPPPI